MAVASGEGSAHDLTPLVGRGAGSVGHGAWGESKAASECEERELAVIEKRQNEANLPVVLIIGIL